MPKRGSRIIPGPGPGSEPPQTKRKARVGFVRSADANFQKLDEKTRGGLTKKLHAAALNPDLAKPLVGPLKGCRRVTYGRVRAIVRIAEGVAVALVVAVADRKAGSGEDPYTIATEYMRTHGDEAEAALMGHIRAVVESNRKVLSRPTVVRRVVRPRRKS